MGKVRIHSVEEIKWTKILERAEIRPPKYSNTWPIPNSIPR